MYAVPACMCILFSNDMLQDHDFTPYFFEKRWALNHGYFIERQLKKNDLFVNGLASLILTTFVNYSLHRNKTNSK